MHKDKIISFFGLTQQSSMAVLVTVKYCSLQC